MESKNNFLNHREIVISGNENTVHIDDEAIKWGQQALESMNLENGDDYVKAQKICEYLNDNFGYNFQRKSSIAEIIKKQGGNCVSHTLMGIFLLRLAGIPAKMAHEVHIIKQFRLISLYVGLWAKKANNGINSFWHNDHVWVLFRNIGTWEPFDSALGVCGLDHFYQKRFYQHSELSKGFAQKWTGPPFVIWEGVGRGFDGMKNITSSIINPEAMMIKNAKEWRDFVNTFVDWKQDDFHKEYLPRHLMQKIKAMSIQWFAK